MSGAVASFLSSLHSTADEVNIENIEVGVKSTTTTTVDMLKQTAKDRVNFDELSHSSFASHEELFSLLQTTIAHVKNAEIQEIVSALDAIEAHYVIQLNEISSRRGAQLDRIRALCEQVDSAHERLDGMTQRMRAFYDEFMRD